jgi:hypothetical protein
MCAFESTCALLLLFRAVKSRRNGIDLGILSSRITFISLLYEHAFVYFCITTCLSIATLVLVYHTAPGFLQRSLNAFSLPLSCVLTARFLLHLRKCEYKLQHGISLKSGAYSTTDGFSSEGGRSVHSTFRAAVPEYTEFAEDIALREMDGK